MMFLRFLFFCAILLPDSVGAQPLSQAVRTSVDAIAPCIVRIETTSGIESSSAELSTAGPTTGVVVHADGWIVASAYGLAHKPAGIVVTVLSDPAQPQRFAAKVVATDHTRKLTLLKIDATGLPVPQATPLDAIRVGQYAIAAGRTLSLQQPSISVGIVSAIGRIWGKAIQTDAKVSPINYGGPLIDMEGRVLGILVPLSPVGNRTDAGVEWYDAGVGFAIPFAEVQAIFERLKTGDVLPGLSGIAFRDDNALFEPPIIARLAWQSPAEKAALKAGDQITAVDGKKVARIADVRNGLGNHSAGDVVRITVDRGGKEIAADLPLVSELDPYRAAFLGVLPKAEASDTGCVIDSVIPDSPAAAAGLQSGDRITGFDGTPVKTTLELTNAMRTKVAGTSVTVRWNRGGKEEQTAVTLAELPEALPAGFAMAKNAGKTAPLAWQEEKLSTTKETYQVLQPARTQNPSLILWFANPGDPEPEAFKRAWAPVLQQNDLIIARIAADPNGQWTPGVVQMAIDVVTDMKRTLLDDRRVLLLGLRSATKPALAFRQRFPEQVRGVIVGPRIELLPSEPSGPETPLRFLFITRADGADHNAAQVEITALRQLRYPVTVLPIKTLEGILSDPDTADAIGRWSVWLSVL